MRLSRTFAALWLSLPAWTAHACTVCDSHNGQQLRAGLFDGHFLRTACVVAAPVPLLALAILFSHIALAGIARPDDPKVLSAAQEDLLPGAELLA